MFATSRALRVLVLTMLMVPVVMGRARAVPVFANGQGVSCEVCHTTFPGMTRYGMMVMMSNFQILNEHLQNEALPLAARVYITSMLANKQNHGSTQVSDLSLLGGGFIGRNFTWYLEQHVINSGVIGDTEQSWLSWNGLLHGTNSLQVGKFHTPFPFMPAHAWTISDYLLADQTTGQNQFNPNDARWGVAFNGMSNEFMYNLSWLTGSGPMGDALDYNSTRNPRAIDANISYGGMEVPWSVGLVGMRGWAPLASATTFEGSDKFSREGVYFGYQTDAWHYQTMYYHGYDAHPNLTEFNVPLNGYFFELERDLGWRNHITLRYDVASSDTLNRQYVIDIAHNVLPNLAIVGEDAMYVQGRPQFALQFAFAGPYQYGKRYLSNLHVAPVNEQKQIVPKYAEPLSPGSSAAASAAPSAGNANAGAALVSANGCEGCHGVGLKGGQIGPALYGIEHRLNDEQIGSLISSPKAPMPNFGFNQTQIGDIVAYLTSLDGGSTGAKPVVTFSPAAPTDQATITVRFSGTPPREVSVIPAMTMGGASMAARKVELKPSPSDPHVFTGLLVVSMGGPWTIELEYDGTTMDVPLNVGA